MQTVVQKYLVIPLVAVIGVYVVGTVTYELFGVPAIVLFSAVGGTAFFVRFCNCQ